MSDSFPGFGRLAPTTRRHPARQRFRPALLAVFLVLPSSLAAQTPDPEPELAVNAVRLSIGGRVQTQFNTSSIEDVAPSQLMIRRARIEFEVEVSEHVTGVIQSDFAGGGADLKDAYLQLHLDPGLQILAGQTMRPFGLLQQTSSKRMPPVERGLRIRGLSAADQYALTSGLAYADRDIGVQVSGAPDGAPLGLTYALGWLRGPLHGEVGNQDSYQFAGRVTLEPVRSLRLGAGWSSRQFAGVGTPPELERGHAFEIDLEYGEFAPGFHLLAEVSGGDLDPFADATFWGAQSWLAYRSGPLGSKVTGVEPLVRVSYAETDPGMGGEAVPGGILVTPGINLYLGELTRLMVNLDVWRGEDDSQDAEGFKAMLQFAF